MRRLVLLIGGLSLFAQPVVAQGVGVAAHAGTLGLGVDVGLGTGRFGIRVGGNIFPVDVDLTASDVKYTIDLPSPQFTSLVDLYLIGGLRVSGGLFFSGDDVVLTGELTENVEIGDNVYTPAQIGTLTGAIINEDVSPYLGIGFGNPAASRFGFFLDIGIAFQGAPAVTLSADGPISTVPGFQQDLDDERQAAEEDVEIFKYYPVISIGFSIRLGGR